MQSQWKVNRSPVEKAVYTAEESVDRSGLDALLRRVIAMDPELGGDMEEAVNALVTPWVEAGFVAGYQAAMHPERIIFGEVRP